jgi:hypothetical protein
VQCRGERKISPPQSGFLGWYYPADRALFMATNKDMPKMYNNTFVMNEIVQWEKLAKLGGLANGTLELLQPGTGVASWQAFLRIFVEVR